MTPSQHLTPLRRRVQTDGETHKGNGMKLTKKEGEEAGVFALIYLCMVLIGLWFNIAAIVWYHIKKWFV